jgi:hypothetical protein
VGVVVIVCFRPLPAKDAELVTVLRDHRRTLMSEDLVGDRPWYAMRTRDGTYIEVFEWKSEEAIAAAHSNAAVLALWDRFDAVCEYERIANVAEAHELFPGFEPVDLEGRP